MADMQLTSQQMLDEVNKAIYSICVGGQSYTIQGRSLTRADLGQLREMQKNLKAEVMDEGGSSTNLMGDTYVAVFDGR